MSCAELFVWRREFISIDGALSSLVLSLGLVLEPLSVGDSSSLSPQAAKSSPFSMALGCTARLIQTPEADQWNTAHTHRQTVYWPCMGGWQFGLIWVKLRRVDLLITLNLMSLVRWDNTVLPSTRYKWTHPALNPARGQYSIYLPRRDGRLSWSQLPVTYLETSRGRSRHVRHVWPNSAPRDIMSDSGKQL